MAYSNGRRMPSFGLSPGSVRMIWSPGSSHLDGVRGAQFSAAMRSVIESSNSHDGVGGGSTGSTPNPAYSAAISSAVGTVSRKVRSSMRPWNGFRSRSFCGKLPPILMPFGSVSDVGPLPPQVFAAVYSPASSSPFM